MKEVNGYEFSKLMEQKKKESKQLQEIEKKDKKDYCKRCWHKDKKLVIAKYSGMLGKKKTLCKKCYNNSIKIMFGKE